MLVEGLLYTLNPGHQFPKGNPVLFFVVGVVLRGVEGEAVHVLDDGDAELVNLGRGVESFVFVAVDVSSFHPSLLEGRDVGPDTVPDLTVPIVPRLVGAAEDRGLRRRGGSGVVVVGLHDDVGAVGVGVWWRWEIVA